MLDLIVNINDFAVKHNFVEVVCFELIDLDSLRYQMFVQQVLVFSLACFGEGNVVKLANVADIIDGEALLELIWQLLHVLFVANWEYYSGDVVVFARSQLLPHSTNTDDLAKRCDFTSHG